MHRADGSADASRVLGPAGLGLRTFFLHFFDIHFLKERGAQATSVPARAEMDLAVRFAVILGARIFVPAASYYENPIARAILDTYAPTEQIGLFTLVGSGSTPSEFTEEKLHQYAKESFQFSAYSAALVFDFPWRRRARSATKDIKAAWGRRGETDGIRETFSPRHLTASEDAFASAWDELPDRIGDSAFIVENVLPLLPVAGGNLVVSNTLHSMINEDYFSSFVRELKACVFQDMVQLGSGPLPSGSPSGDISYGTLLKACRNAGVLGAIRSAPPWKLEEFITDTRFLEAFSSTQTSGPVWTPSTQVSDTPRVRSTMKPRIDLAIVCALPKEAEAVEAVFGKGEPVQFPDDRHIYRRIGCTVAGRKRTVVVATLSEMGNANAAVATADIRRTFDFDLVALVGIAGGVPTPAKPETHVRLGDVVISTKIVEYDRQKATAGFVERRDHPQRVGYAWLQAANNLKRGRAGFDDAWRRSFTKGMKALGEASPDPLQYDIHRDPAGQVVEHPADPRRKAGPLVHQGIIGAGDTLVKDPVLRDEIGALFSIQAFEMEGAGVREAAWAGNLEMIAVRGIVDYCDGFKDDRWHLSGVTAAASVCHLLWTQILIAQANAETM